ncbi:MAG: tetratricopeptide repeat protein, partial [Bacteroidaceae bacterium]
MDIAKLINNRDKLNAMTLRELRNLVERYPFYHLARMLYVANLYAMHDPSLSEELTKASLLVPDRTV